MSIFLLIQGVIVGFVVAVPVGPVGLLCINRALTMGALCGLCSGLGVATADAIAAGIVALGLALLSDFLINQQVWLRLVGGIYLCYLGLKMYKTKLSRQPAAIDVNGMLGAYATTFVLTISNPVTVLSFIAIYAGWGVESLSGHFLAAAMLTAGVFTGSSLWWVALFLGLTTFPDVFSSRVVGWIHRVCGAVIAGFGIVVLLSISQRTLGIRPW